MKTYAIGNVTVTTGNCDFKNTSCTFVVMSTSVYFQSYWTLMPIVLPARNGLHNYNSMFIIISVYISKMCFIRMIQFEFCFHLFESPAYL